MPRSAGRSRPNANSFAVWLRNPNTNASPFGREFGGAVGETKVCSFTQAYFFVGTSTKALHISKSVSRT
jgi:hypothetical protein